MKQRLARLLPTLRRARDLFPITFVGIVAGVCASIALFYYGIERIDLVLLVVGIVVLALLALAMLGTTLTSFGLWLRLRKRKVGDALQLECGTPSTTDFFVGSPWYVPFVRVGWSWVTPEARLRIVRSGPLLREEVTPVRRCLRSEVVRRIEVSCSFGFTRVAFLHREERACRFVPSVGGLRSMHVVRSMAGGEDISHPDGPPDGERIDLRRYMPGDPIRFVLWKVFARTRDLVVRTPERAIAPSRQTVAYLIATTDDEPAAGAARVAVDSGALGTDWVLGADGQADYARTKGAALEVLTRSAESPESEGGTGLLNFLRSATPGQTGRAVVFVPGKTGPWLERTLAALRSFATAGMPRHPVEFVVCTDGIERNEDTSKVSRFLKSRNRPELPAREGIGPALASEVADVVRALGSARARVIVIDRRNGRVFNQSHYAPRAAPVVTPAGAPPASPPQAPPAEAPT